MPTLSDDTAPKAHSLEHGATREEGGSPEGASLGPVTVLDLTVDGGSLARPGEKVLFLDRGIPGQQVTCTVQKEEKRFTRAQVTGVLCASPNEAEPWCPDFSRCGGCAWQNISEPFLLEWKQGHVRETLARIGGVRAPVEKTFASPGTRQYRTKISYAFGFAGGKPALGLRCRNSHEIAPLAFCGLQPACAETLLDRARDLLSAGCTVWDGRPVARGGQGGGYLRHLVLHTQKNTSAVQENPRFVVELITSPQGQSRNHSLVRQLLLGLLEDTRVAGVVHSERRGTAALAMGEKPVFTRGTTDCQAEYGGKTFLFPHDAFMQTNTAVADALYAKAMECARITPSDKVWDLYCGTGAIGLLAACQGAQLFGVDGQNNAIAFARKNAAFLGVAAQCLFEPGNIDRAVLNAPFDPDCILVDPPRAGLSKNCLEQMKNSTASRIVYISCDVATQARDIRALGNRWQLKGVFPFDMFPATPHIENLCLLERK